MRSGGNTVLVTGGSSGIGLAIANEFARLGNTVVICARGQSRLAQARVSSPSLHTIDCDISAEDGRMKLYRHVSSDFKDLNVLVNNAGIQRRIDLTRGMEDILANDDEIEVNLRAQIYLSARFIPLLMKRDSAAIINVSSGLGIVPMAIFPIYSATKAAMRSFTMSLRYQLKDTCVKVFDAVPPAVHDTGLKGKPAEKSQMSVSSEEMARAVIDGFKADRYEIAAGPSQSWLFASKNADLDRAFQGMNR